ncbi:hypothetical protein [Francisella-like endosymbiont]
MSELLPGAIRRSKVLSIALFLNSMAISIISISIFTY